MRERVYELVRRVPPGRVTTFGDLAALCGSPRAARQVGWALASLPDGHDVPWWRVIRGDGSMPGHDHQELQIDRLSEEGVDVSAAGVVGLGRYRWEEEGCPITT